MKKLLIVCLLLCFVSPLAIPAELPVQAPISIISLLGDPDRYAEKEITVIGYLRLDKEGSYLFLHSVDYDNGLLPNAILIRPNKDMMSRRADLDGKYVALSGTIRINKTSYRSMPLMTLTDVSHATFWSDPEHPKTKAFESLGHNENLH